MKITAAIFLEELKTEWCKSKEQHKSFEKDLIKYGKLYSDEILEKENFLCEDFYRCDNQCEFCKEVSKKYKP
jgi:hypothetical protein